MDKLFGGELDFEVTKRPVKIKDIHKVEKRTLWAFVFWLRKKNKLKYPIYMSKNALKTNTLIYY